MQQRTVIERQPDFLDRAQDLVQLAVEDGVAHVRRAQERVPKPTGFCMSCDVECDVGFARFCSPECSVDWHRAQAARARNGRGADE